MKRIVILIALLLAATGSFAQSEAPASPFRTHVIEVHHRQPVDIAAAIRLLQSGSKGAELTVNHELRTITVRDYPENLATIEDAIKRLDVPRAASANAMLKIWIAVASKAPIPNAGALPEDLEPVIRELKSTLRYSHYALLSTSMTHVASGTSAEASGVADASVLGMGVDVLQPPFYTYRLQQPMVTNGERPAVTTEKFSFGIKVPIDGGKGVTYQHVGFETPVTVRDKEKVVIGTTTVGDRAVIVVVSADIAK
jgi:hypothetical protein